MQWCFSLVSDLRLSWFTRCGWCWWPPPFGLFVSMIYRLFLIHFLKQHGSQSECIEAGFASCSHTFCQLPLLQARRRCLCLENGTGWQQSYPLYLPGCSYGYRAGSGGMRSDRTQVQAVKYSVHWKMAAENVKNLLIISNGRCWLRNDRIAY